MELAMSDKFGVLAEAPGGAKAVEAGGEYVAPRMMLSFPDDEWDAQERYRRALLDRGLISPVRVEDKNIPDWWRRFAVCSYGDQMAQQPYNVLTADGIEDYLAEYCRLLFSGEPDCLDADGLRIKLQHSKAPQKETVQPPKKGLHYSHKEILPYAPLPWAAGALLGDYLVRALVMRARASSSSS